MGAPPVFTAGGVGRGETCRFGERLPGISIVGSTRVLATSLPPEICSGWLLCIGGALFPPLVGAPNSAPLLAGGTIAWTGLALLPSSAPVDSGAIGVPMYAAGSLLLSSGFGGVR